MLSFNAVITRNNYLYYSALNYKFNEKYSYQRFSVIVNSLTKRHIFYQKNHSRKVTLINNGNILLKRIHTSSSLNCLSPLGENDKLLQLLSNQQQYSNTKDSLKQLNSPIKNNSNNEYDNNPNQSIPVNKSCNSSEHHNMNVEKYSLKDIEKMYQNPVSKLNEIYHKVNMELQKTAFFIHFDKIKDKTDKWKCTIQISWPTEFSFSAFANNKDRARIQASLKCLHWLENQKKVHRGKVIMYKKQDIMKLFKTPTRISIHPDTLFKAKLIADKYDENLKCFVDSLSEIEDEMFKFSKYQKDTLADPVGRGDPNSTLPEKIKNRNHLLQLRYNSRMLTNDYSDLPIKKFREQILTELANNQVILIKGDTGCGKTTQVPQYIMDEFAKNNAATDCNIIVTQPRRISAISLAERVAEERQEHIGDVVGYQVRLDQILPSTPGGILYCTSGILLRKLIFNPTLQNCSHVIIDEAHERAINIDLILGLLKRAMKKNHQLKVIVMSATLNAELFEKYFNCKVIEVPGHIFPVEMNFMDDINRLHLPAPNQYDLTFKNSKEKKKDAPETDICKMGELILWIVKNKPEGAILCFLPGWSEITLLKKYLEEFAFVSQNKICLFLIHSRISPYEQKKIFFKPQQNYRKIVLATDIAETGLTVSDVTYVVDSCIHKQKKWIENRGILSIDNTWVSKANIEQRKGRAGRVKPGISYHMISREQYDQLNPFPIPEIKRISLEKTVLDIKTYSDEKIMSFIDSMPEPPPFHSVKLAINNLIKLGAIDNNENLTALGKRIAFFSNDPKYSKAIVYSTIFQCLSPILTIAAIATADHDLFTNALFNKTAIRQIKKTYHPTSDHISMAWLFQHWKKYFSAGRDEARSFCKQNNLYNERMYTISRIRDLQTDYLTIVRMLPYKEMYDDADAPVNEYSELDELVKGVMLSGLNSILYHRNFNFRKGIIKKDSDAFVMNDNSNAKITTESVNFKRKKWPSPYILFDQRTHLSEARMSFIRDSSIISPLTTFLFCQDQILGSLENTESTDAEDDNNNNDNKSVIFTVKNNPNINLICDKETANVLINFREAMWGMVRYMVATAGLTHYEKTEAFEQINSYRTELLQVLAKMLTEAASKIDTPEDENDRDCNK